MNETLSDNVEATQGDKGLSDPGNRFTPMIPDRPLFWNGIPLFHVGVFPKGFSGTLYFVLGQGLGDHVNGFRILHEVKKRFPSATFVVYADTRWEELVRRIEGIQIRWYPKAMDVVSKSGTNNPYDSALHEIKNHSKSSPGNIYLAYEHFPMPDRHARQETTLEATARSIGLALGPEPRSFLPILPSDVEWTREFLKIHGIGNERYAVIAPFTWPVRRWSKKNFSDLIDELLEKYGIRSVVISYPEIGPFTNKGAVCAFDLTLGQIAGLLQGARLYVGLDSGPSHMAAALDLPMVVVFVNKKVIPFEVRPLSPRALLVVDSLFNLLPEPPLRTVFDAASYLLHEDKKKPSIPNCPVCHRVMGYVVKSSDSCLRLMCACGVATDRSFSGSLSEKGNPSFEGWTIPDRTPLDLNKEIVSLETFLQWDRFLEGAVLNKIEWVVRSNNDDLTSPLDPGSLILSLDSLLRWMWGKGFIMSGYQKYSKSVAATDFESLEIVSFEKGVHGLAGTGKKISIPWKDASLTVTQDQYVRWYSFKRWADPHTLVGIVKSQTELGFSTKIRFRCAWVSFRYKREIRSFRWLVKTFLMNLSADRRQGQECPPH